MKKHPATSLRPATLALTILTIFTLLLLSSIPARAMSLTSADCQCCHTASLSDRHHLFVQTQGYECLGCHKMIWNQTLGVWMVADIRDCLSCHVTSVADRHHLAKPNECLSCHAVLFDPATSSYYIHFNSTCQSATQVESCTDAIDNDGDQLIDCADPNCVNTSNCQPAAENCTDAVDNDGDGLVDCSDSDCAGTDVCRVDRTSHYAMHAVPPSDCGGCHLENLVDEHREKCSLCHQSVAPAVQQAITSKSTTCVACHPPTRHTMKCGICHNPVPTGYVPSQLHWSHLHRVSCGECHMVPATTLEPSGQNCRTCHGVARPWTSASVPDLHRAHVKRTPLTQTSPVIMLPYTCNMCHGQTTPQFKPDQCFVCHSDGRTFLASQLTSIHATHSRLFDCSNCHFDPRDIKQDTSANVCVRCHESRAYTSRYTLHQQHWGKQCWACHTSDTIVSRATFTCADCHGSTPDYQTLGLPYVHRQHGGSGSQCWMCHPQLIPIFPTTNQTHSTALGNIEGTVTDSKGVGISQATVKTSDGKYSTLTGSNGTYTLSYVLGGLYTLTASKAGYTSSSKPVNVIVDQTVPLNFSLKNATTGAITGVVKSPAGVALASVTVRTSTGTYSTLTNSSGAYTLSGVAQGSYTLTASLSGYAPVTQAVAVTAGQTATADFTMTAQPMTGTISGVVKSSTGMPLSQVSVQTGEGKYSAITDSSGTYTLSNVPAGAHTLSASKTGYSTAPQAVTVTAGQTATANFAMTATATTGTVTGVVKSSSGTPIASATVRTSDRRYSGVTNTAGAYTLSNVTAGGYTLTASKTGYASKSIPVTVVTGQTVTANFSLAKKK